MKKVTPYCLDLLAQSAGWPLLIRCGISAMGMARIAPVARKLREQGGFQGAKAAQPDWLRPSWDSAWQNLFARHQSESRGPLAAGRELACVMRNCVRLNYIQVIDLMNFFKYDRFSSQIYALKHPKWRPSFKLGQVARFD